MYTGEKYKGKKQKSIVATAPNNITVNVPF